MSGNHKDSGSNEESGQELEAWARQAGTPSPSRGGTPLEHRHRHRQSIGSISKLLPLSTPHSDILVRAFEWDFDLIALNAATNNHAMVVLTTHFITLYKDQILQNVDLRMPELYNYLDAIHDAYRPDVLYHNQLHAADVVQCMVWLINGSNGSPGLLDKITPSDDGPISVPLALFASIIGAAVHDVDHPGTNNDFQIRTRSPLAVLYNDMSVLENHHCATAFSLLKTQGRDALANLPHDEYDHFRRLVIDMVLATDLSKHFELMSKMPSANDPKHALCHALHCADVSNTARPLHICLVWVDMIMREFFSQGEIERSVGLPISRMMDRGKTNISRVQIGFLDVICRPLFAQLQVLLPKASECCFNLEVNRQFWIEHEDQMDEEMKNGTQRIPRVVASSVPNMRRPSRFSISVPSMKSALASSDRLQTN